jgi:hypothetical protein|tara:strand:+ start:384 stop:716 length:333 start_codon:yes stop_codon:yes gene_type:complete
MSTETQTETETEKKSDNDWSKREMGALWRREGKSQNYLSGYVKFGEFGTEKEVRVIVFTNKGKSKNPKAPDFVIYESQELNAESATTTTTATAAKAPVQEKHDSEVPAGL